MSKYAGSITVVDDQGNVAFERELGTDEIIDALVERISFFQKPPEAGGAIVVGPHNISAVIKQAKESLGGTTKRHYKKREDKVAVKPVAKSGRFTKKECCGSTGSRHFKWCTEMGGTGDPGLVAVKGGRIPFSEGTYNAVRKMYADGIGTDGIVSEKGFDAEECRKIRMSSTYDAYRRAK